MTNDQELRAAALAAAACFADSEFEAMDVAEAVFLPWLISGVRSDRPAPAPAIPTDQIPRQPAPMSRAPLGTPAAQGVEPHDQVAEQNRAHADWEAEQARYQEQTAVNQDRELDARIDELQAAQNPDDQTPPDRTPSNPENVEAPDTDQPQTPTSTPTSIPSSTSGTSPAAAPPDQPTPGGGVMPGLNPR